MDLSAFVYWKNGWSRNVATMLRPTWDEAIFGTILTSFFIACKLELEIPGQITKKSAENKWAFASQPKVPFQ